MGREGPGVVRDEWVGMLGIVGVRGGWLCWANVLPGLEGWCGEGLGGYEADGGWGAVVQDGVRC